MLLPKKINQISKSRKFLLVGLEVGEELGIDVTGLEVGDELGIDVIGVVVGEVDGEVVGSTQKQSHFWNF